MEFHKSCQAFYCLFSTLVVIFLFFMARNQKGEIFLNSYTQLLRYLSRTFKNFQFIWVRIMTSRYKCVFFTVSLLFIAVAISPPWGHAGMKWDQNGMSVNNNMDSIGGKIIFNGIPTETECRNCHDDPDRFPVLEYSNVVLHHNLIDTVIPEPGESTAPDAPDAVPGELYGCLSCHCVSDDCSSSSFRDCLQCHPVWIVTGSPGCGDNVHHVTSGHGNCEICHSD